MVILPFIGPVGPPKSELNQVLNLPICPYVTIDWEPSVLWREKAVLRGEGKIMFICCWCNIIFTYKVFSFSITGNTINYKFIYEVQDVEVGGKCIRQCHRPLQVYERTGR
ncbi:hypothetical protein C5167_028904 [Papaver somniferum]|nr:hypothetical protein C5167_028904 [Papaver somniferum]